MGAWQKWPAAINLLKILFLLLFFSSVSGAGKTVKAKVRMDSGQTEEKKATLRLLQRKKPLARYLFLYCSLFSLQEWHKKAAEEKKKER